MKTMWTNNETLEINPPCWESAMYFLETFTYVEAEFGMVDLAATGMFDLSHPATAEELNLTKALRTLRHKVSITKSILHWIADNKELLEDCPLELIAK